MASVQLESRPVGAQRFLLIPQTRADAPWAIESRPIRGFSDPSLARQAITAWFLLTQIPASHRLELLQSNSVLSTRFILMATVLSHAPLRRAPPLPPSEKMKRGARTWLEVPSWLLSLV